jgi:hypothetical protein
MHIHIQEWKEKILIVCDKDNEQVAEDEAVAALMGDCEPVYAQFSVGHQQGIFHDLRDVRHHAYAMVVVNICRLDRQVRAIVNTARAANVPVLNHTPLDSPAYTELYEMPEGIYYQDGRGMLQPQHESA